MARPKVLPNNRKRVTEACNFCRSSKKRCSGIVPCTACLRRGIADTCVLTYQPRRRGSTIARPQQNNASTTIHVGGGRIEAVAGLNEGAASSSVNPNQNNGEPSGAASTDQGQTSPTLGPLCEHATTHYHAPSSGSITSSNTAESHSRMLLNRRGDRVFIGEFASISFLQFVREIVSAKIGPSQFSHNDKNENMLETQSATVDPSASGRETLELPPDELSSYVETYRLATSGLIDVLSDSESEFLASSHTGLAQTSHLTDPTLETLVIAIGAQCKSLVSSQGIGETLFRRAQTLAFSSMLQDPDINMIRVFLLMSFYMLGRCQRNTAFMYLGIAVRAAVSIGLHSNDSFLGPTSAESQLRLRIWVSVCNVDILVSSILGRPPATGGLRLSLKNLDSTGGQFVPSKEAPSIVPAFELLVVINQIIDDIYTKKNKSISTAERLLKSLQQWSKNLPTSLLREVSSSEQTNQKELIAKIHVSCIYYFAVTLITRPALISSLTTDSSLDETTLRQLSSACQDAAIYLSQTCAEAYTKGLLLGNMCFLKALIFAAGLILGFAMFEEQNRDADVDAAFRGTTDVLGFLSIQSLQASHYLEILSCLASAIDKLRQKRPTRGRNKYVGKIFTFTDAEEPPSQHDDMNSTAAISGILGLSDDQNFFNLSSPDTQFLVGGELDAALDWDVLNPSQWDTYPFGEQRSLDTSVS